MINWTDLALLSTDFILMILIPAVVGFVWRASREIAELKGKVETLAAVVAAREGK